jgi:hypothetical protein
MDDKGTLVLDSLRRNRPVLSALRILARMGLRGHLLLTNVAT